MREQTAEVSAPIEQEFLSVIREYERVIYKVCYLYANPNAPLNDLYQDVVLNLWKAYPKFRKECKVSTWIYRIALNTCISFYRKEKNVPEIVSLTRDTDWAIEAHDPINEMLKQLYQMINQLGQLDKSIILLYLEDKSYEEIAAHGIRVQYNNEKILAGNEKLMKKAGVAISEEHNDEGTAVYACVDGKYAGCITISDMVKDSSKAAIAELKKLGIKQTVMLTGDTKQTAERVAGEIGIDRTHSELLPADKVNEVEILLAEKEQREKLAFVGDGINDAPVLSRADIGIAMGALGSDAAIEAADVVLMDDNPCKIALAMKISANTLKIVRQNIIFALAVKLVCLILGATGDASMWTAIFADVGVMVIAVLNAMRAMRIKK